MSTYFSEKFKELRKKQNLTQEQVAEIFYVSPQAVSRWETGSNNPDIDILPHIAIYFNVTVDELLGTKMIAKEEKAKEYAHDIWRLRVSGKLEKSIELARKALKIYPTNSEIHVQLVVALSEFYFKLANVDTEKANKCKDEIISTNKRMINLTDYKSSLGHRAQLLQNYALWGMNEEAKEIIETLPDEIWHTKEPWLGLVLEGEEGRKNQKIRIKNAGELFVHLVNGFKEKETSILQKIECHKAIIQIEHLVNIIAYNKEERDFAHWSCVFESINIACLYCEMNNASDALEWLEKAVQHTLHYLKFHEEGYNYRPWDWDSTRNLPWVLWEEYLMKPCFDFIRSDEKFKNHLEMLKSNSRELK